MDFKKEVLLFTLFSIVFLAGCTQAPSGPTAAGVIIKSFASEIPEVPGSSEVIFAFTVQNTGGKRATNVKAELFGLSTEWVCETPGRAPGDCTIGSWNLEGADVSNNFVGEEASNEIIVVSPPSKSNDITYDATLRIAYEYTTVTDGKVRFVTDDYIRVNPTQKDLAGVEDSSTTPGPLIVTVRAVAPIISGTATTGKVQFEIQNIGGGRVFLKQSSPDESTSLDKLNQVTITASGLKSCRGVPVDAGSNTISFTDAIRLAGGKSTVITCELDATNIKNYKVTDVSLAIDYGYFVDSTTQVTVMKAL